jgi:hypothetical protein
MKRKLTLLLMAASSILAVNAQTILLSEDFNAPNPPSGWVLVNNSAPTGTPGQTWAQPTASVTFPAYNGSPNDYIFANWASTSNTVAGQTISNWLISPVVTLQNSAVIQFATRTTTTQMWADRMEVYISSGAGTNVGTTPTSVGTFTYVGSINPNQISNGYPPSWTVYNATLTGVGTPAPGRFAFRYYVTNGGYGGTNSDYIGLDAVRYLIPGCQATVQSYTVCQGTSVTLTAVGASNPATYLWGPTPSTNSTVVVNPSSTTVYTLNYSENGNPCPAKTATVTIGTQLGVGISPSSSTLCTGQTVTLTATGGNSNTQYLWGTQGGTSPLGTASTAVVTVTANTTYTLGAANGACFGTANLALNPVASPTLSSAMTPTAACSGSSVTLTGTGSGVSSFVWWTSPTNSTTTNPLSIAPALGPVSYTLTGVNSSGCAAAINVNFTVNSTPTVAASSGGGNVHCAKSQVVLTASGASSYVWSGAGSSTSNPYNFVTGSSAGTQSLTVVGSNGGCTGSAAISLSVDACTGITKIDENSNGTIFPNPFANELRVSGITGTIELYNSTGMLVLSAQVTDTETINTTTLAKGVYLIKGINTNGDVIKAVRLVKN